MILITGATGYLGQELLKHFASEQVILFTDRLQVSVNDLMCNYSSSNITHIYHLAAPTTEDDFAALGKSQLYKSIIKGTQTIIEFANQINAKVIYFSTEGILEDMNTCNDYCRFKKIATDMVNYISNDYKILVIPRVYSSDRKKGLIKALREDKVPEADMDNRVTYIDLKSFIKQFKKFIKSSDKIHYFKNKEESSLRELKDKYIA